MAATESGLGNVMFEVSAVDADWISTNALRIKSVIFYPSAANDILRVQEYLAGDTTDPGVWLKSLDGGPIGCLLNSHESKFIPWIDFSECTFSNAANVKVTFVLGRSA